MIELTASRQIGSQENDRIRAFIVEKGDSSLDTKSAKKSSGRLSLSPLGFEEAVSTVLKVKPQGKRKNP